MRLADHTVRADEVGDPPRIFFLWTAGRAIPNGDLPLCVGDEWEFKIVLIPESGVGHRLVEADTDDSGVLFLIVIREVPEPGTFRGSAGCIGFRIEPKDDVSPAVIAEGDLASFLIGPFEVGGPVARFERQAASEERMSNDFENAEQ